MTLEKEYPIVAMSFKWILLPKYPSWVFSQVPSDRRAWFWSWCMRTQSWTRDRCIPGTNCQLYHFVVRLRFSPIIFLFMTRCKIKNKNLTVLPFLKIQTSNKWKLYGTKRIYFIVKNIKNWKVLYSNITISSLLYLWMILHCVTYILSIL